MGRITVADLRKQKLAGQKIVMLTAYDYPTAKIMSECPIDVILVGDSLGMVVLGYADTIPVTVADIVYHTKAVVRGNSRALIVADMPFLSYKVTIPDAIKNAGRMLQEGGAQAVKVEGGSEVADVVAAMVRADIPVMAHLGVMPQAINVKGGYALEGRDAGAAERLLADAQALVDAGVFAIVLEKIPLELAGRITAAVKVPTIGIGAGVHCNGQVLVTHDILGLFDRFKPKFAKRYLDLHGEMKRAFTEFAAEVGAAEFPTADQSYKEFE